MGTEWKRVPLLLTPELLKAIDEWRRQQSDLPDRNEAIRRLLDSALKEAGAEQPEQ